MLWLFDLLFKYVVFIFSLFGFEIHDFAHFLIFLFCFFFNLFFIFYFLCVNRGQTKYSIENPKKNVRNNEDFATM